MGNTHGEFDNLVGYNKARLSYANGGAGFDSNLQNNEKLGTLSELNRLTHGHGSFAHINGMRAYQQQRVA